MTLFGVSSLSFLGVSLGEITKKIVQWANFWEFKYNKTRTLETVKGFYGQVKGFKGKPDGYKGIWALFGVSSPSPVAAKNKKK